MTKILISVLLICCFNGKTQPINGEEILNTYLNECRIKNSTDLFQWSLISSNDFSERNYLKLKEILLNKWSNEEILEKSKNYLLKASNYLSNKSANIAKKKNENYDSTFAIVYDSLKQLKLNNYKDNLLRDYQIPDDIIFIVERFGLNALYPILAKAVQDNNHHFNLYKTKLLLARLDYSPYNVQMINECGYDKRLGDVKNAKDLLYIASQDAIFELSKTLYSNAEECGITPCEQKNKVRYKYLSNMSIVVKNFPLKEVNYKKISIDSNAFSFDLIYVMNIPFPEKDFNSLKKWFVKNRGNYKIDKLATQRP